MSRHGLTSRDTPGLERVLEVLLDPWSHEDVDRWRAAVNRELRPLLGADKLSFQLPLPSHVLLYSEEADPKLLREYTDQHIPNLERRKNYFARILDLGVGNRTALWGDELAWFYASEYYNELIVPMRAHDPLWAAVPTPGAVAPAILLAHHDRRGGRRFGQRGLEIMRLIRPALRASVAAMIRLNAHRSALAAALDRLTDGVLVFDADARLLHQNPAATRILSTGPHGEALRAEAMRLAGSMAPGSAAAGATAGDMAARMAAVGATGGRTRNGASYGPLAANGRPAVDDGTATNDRSAANGEAPGSLGGFRVHATRIAEGALLPGPAVVVLIEAAAHALPSVDRMRERFGLTPRQAEVALLLARRKTNEEIARVLGISPNTARHHTEAVMLALGVRSRRAIAPKLLAEA